MRTANKIKNSIKRCRADGVSVIAGILSVFSVGLLSRLLSGNPLYMLRFCNLGNSIPKAWVFTVIWSVWYIALGFCFGFVLGSRRIGSDIPKYKGSMWFVIMLIFNAVWYPLFFKSGTVFLALVDILIIILFCFLCMVEYIKVYKIMGIVFLLHLVWLMWCFFINLKVFLSI